MRIIVTLLLTMGITHMCEGQIKQQTAKYPVRTLTVEPAIGTKIITLLGSADIRFSNLIQYSLFRHLNLISHTSVAHDFPNPRITDVRQNHSFTTFQKFGIGTALVTKGASHNFSVLAGFKYHRYSGTLDNEYLVPGITSKTTSYSPDYGILYNYKKGKGRMFFSSRLYLPLNDGVFNMFETANLELGVGFQLK